MEKNIGLKGLLEQINSQIKQFQKDNPDTDEEVKNVPIDEPEKIIGEEENAEEVNTFLQAKKVQFAEP